MIVSIYILLIYIVSVILNYIIYKTRIRRENRKKLDVEELTIILFPGINTLSLIIELWDKIIK